jgi:DNA-binding SARP family transcriptional activator
VTLTDRFELAVNGQQLRVPHSVERLIAYLALARGAVARAQVAGELWSGTPEQRAASNLRTTLWRLHKVSLALVSSEAHRLRLSPRVHVDVHEVLDTTSGLRRTDYDVLGAPVLPTVTPELLPNWDEMWVVVERERYRIRRLEAMDRLAAALLERHRPVEALLAALDVVRSEPLRESAWRLVVQAHLDQGNYAQAVLAFRDYERLLYDDLGIAPSPLIRGMMAPVLLPLSR